MYRKQCEAFSMCKILICVYVFVFAGCMFIITVSKTGLATSVINESESPLKFPQYLTITIIVPSELNDPSLGAADGTAGSDDEDDEDDEPKVKTKKRIGDVIAATAKARLSEASNCCFTARTCFQVVSASVFPVATDDMTSMLKVGKPMESSTQVIAFFSFPRVNTSLRCRVALRQKLIRAIVPDIEKLGQQDGDSARRIKSLPVILGDVCCGITPQDVLLGLSVSNMLRGPLLFLLYSFTPCRRSSSEKCERRLACARLRLPVRATTCPRWISLASG